MTLPPEAAAGDTASMDAHIEDKVHDSQNIDIQDPPVHCVKDGTNVSYVSQTNMEGAEKEENHGTSTTNEQSEVFKKPGLLIGPRKGKAVGKVQAYKASNNFEEKHTEEESIETPPEPPASESISTNKEIKMEVEEESETPVPTDNKTLSKHSPAQKLKENSLPLPYKEPKWSGMPTSPYKFEVLKNGSIVETVDLSTKPFFVLGRLVYCDIHMAHPTVSRYHAVLQYRSEGTTEEPIGFYLYDLGSTHGTFLNKYRIKPNMYVRIHVGHVLKFGGSSRMFILQGPDEDMESESELTVTQLKEKRREQELARELEEQKRLEEEQLQKEKIEKEGIDWGMGDDAEEETDLSENPFAATNNEELYLEDPKKTLRGWFEREGYDLEYNVEEKGYGQFLCRVELPIDIVKGGSLTAEAFVKGKKKESVVQCALEACRILDRYGLLRQATHESKKRKSKDWEENDFYDSDEDTFLDRTGDLEKKRHRRMKAAGKLRTQTDTYDSLVKKHEEVVSQIEETQKTLDDITRKIAAAEEAAEEEDPLDAFMTNLASDIPDKITINKLKSDLVTLKQEEENVRKLVNIARPASLPELCSSETPSCASSSKSKLTGPIGAKRKVPVQRNKSETVTTAAIEDEDEEEEEEYEEDTKTEENSSDAKSKDVSQSKSLPDPKSSKVPQKLEANGKKLEEMSVEHDTSGNKPVSTESSKETEEKESSDKKSRVIGPALPSDFVPEGDPAEKPKKRTKSKTKKKNDKKNYSDDPNYSMWVPPENQSGDGMTKLNEKYGY